MMLVRASLGGGLDVLSWLGRGEKSIGFEM